MAREDRTRYERLAALLPRAYATEPASSALGALLEVLGELLRDADRDLDRALRDRWLATATGMPAPGEEPGRPDDVDEQPPPAAGQPVDTGEPALATLSLDRAPVPLELLGAALDILRQPWEVEPEMYRARVRLLAPMLARGLGTPRVILAVALSSLASEPCPVLERTGDQTLGVGLAAGMLARCRTCQGGRVQPLPGTPCPMRRHSVMSAVVSDNPHTPMTLHRRRLVPGPQGAGIRVRNDSLYAARPELTLKVPNNALDESRPVQVVACVRSLTSGEEVIVAHALEPGDTLTIRPNDPYDPATPRHRQYWVDRPGGADPAPARAWVTRADGGLVEIDVQNVFFSRGARFDAARFDSSSPVADEARFTSITTAVDTPELPPGESLWLYQPMSRSELAAILADMRGTLPDEHLDGLIAAAPEQPSLVAVALTLRWWARPPARFLLSIPQTPAVAAALAVGADAYLRRMIDRTRPAGVHPIIDISQPPLTEALAPADALRSVDIRLGEPIEPGDRNSLAQLEVALPRDGLDSADSFGFTGLFDVTRFDVSRLADPG